MLFWKSIRSMLRQKILQKVKENERFCLGNVFCPICHICILNVAYLVVYWWLNGEPFIHITITLLLVIYAFQKGFKKKTCFLIIFYAHLHSQLKRRKKRDKSAFPVQRGFNPFLFAPSNAWVIHIWNCRTHTFLQNQY